MYLRRPVKDQFPGNHSGIRNSGLQCAGNLRIEHAVLAAGLARALATLVDPFVNQVISIVGSSISVATEQSPLMMGLVLGGLPKVSRSINWVRVAQRFPVKIMVDKPDPEMFRIGASAVANLEPQ